MTAEDERALAYRRQAAKRKEFQQFLSVKLRGSDYYRKLICEKTKPLLKGERGDTSNE